MEVETLNELLKDKINGIQVLKGVPSLQISQYWHPAWTTTAFVVPRSSIRYRLSIKELEGNCIYVLYDRGYTDVYIGQAGRRSKSHKSVMERLKEHESDNYKESWDMAIVFTSLLDGEQGWLSNTIDMLEHIFIKRTQGFHLNKKNEPLKDDITNYIKEIVYNIETYLCMLLPDIFINDLVSIKEEQVKIASKKFKLDIQDLQDYDGISLVNFTTPEPTVKNMVGRLECYHTLDHKSKILDLSCKGGEFLYEVFSRLMRCKDPFLLEKNDIQRAHYILTKQLFGIASSYNSFRAANMLLYGNDEIENIHHVRNFEINLRAEFKKGYENGVRWLKELIFEVVFKNAFVGEDKENMKFDIIVTNPPYNDNESRGTNNSGNAIYPYFMLAASELADYSSLVVPSGWMLQYPTGVTHGIIDRLRQNKHIAELHDYMNTEEVFNGVSIPSGVCYYVMDKNKTYENCKHIIHNGNGEITDISNIPLYNEKAGVIFRDEYALSIMSKIEEHGEESFGDVLAIAKDHFDDGVSIMISSWDDYSMLETDKHSIKYYLKSNNRVHRDICTKVECDLSNLGYGWVNKEQIPKNADNYKKHKLIVGQAFTAGSSQIMDIPYYIGNNSCCSQSYIPIFSLNDNKEECLNICKYIKTRFFRYLVSVLKIGQHLGSRVYKLAPMQDFSDKSDIDWNEDVKGIEEQLYKKYGLSQKEIDYIGKTIKPMK